PGGPDRVLPAGAQGGHGEPLRLALRLRRPGPRLHQPGRAHPAPAGPGPDQAAGQAGAPEPGRQHPGGQPLRRPRRRPPGDLELRPPQLAGPGHRSAHRPAVGERARPARRRRDQPARTRPQLRLADRHPRHQLLRPADPGGGGPRKGRHGAAAPRVRGLAGPVRHGLLHRPPRPALERQPVPGRAGPPLPDPAAAGRGPGGRRGASAGGLRRAHPRRAPGARREPVPGHRREGRQAAAPGAAPGLSRSARAGAGAAPALIRLKGGGRGRLEPGSRAIPIPSPPTSMSSAYGTETVLAVRHWTDAYFSFTTTRDDGFRFENGQFVMIGLPTESGKPILRAYSIASANWEEQLEFFSIKVQDGPLTSRLQHIKPGDSILIGRKPTGTLLISDLHPGRNLYLLGTGTGLAPWLSVIKDPETYERFERVVLCHGVRHVQDLAYRDYFEKELPNHEILGEIIRDKLLYYPAVSREEFPNRGR